VNCFHPYRSAAVPRGCLILKKETSLFLFTSLLAQSEYIGSKARLAKGSSFNDSPVIAASASERPPYLVAFSPF
jgi:hypothetical protein